MSMNPHRLDMGGEFAEPQGEPRVCLVRDDDTSRTLCGRTYRRPPEQHGARVYQCQECLRAALRSPSSLTPSEPDPT